MEEQLLPFVDTMLKEKCLAGMRPEVFQQLRKDLVRELKSQIDRAIVDELSESQVDEFSALMDSEGMTEEVLQKFIQDSGVDATTVVARTMTRFRELYLGAPVKEE